VIHSGGREGQKRNPSHEYKSGRFRGGRVSELQEGKAKLVCMGGVL